MSSLKKHFVQFGEFAPDARFLSGANLKRAESVLPIYGSHRPAPQMEIFRDRHYSPNVGMDGRTASALYVHLSSESVGSQFAHATDTDIATPYVVPDEATWLEALGGISPDDSSYQFFAHAEIGVDQSSFFKAATSPVVTIDPAGNTNLRVRFKGIGAEIGNWIYAVEWGSVTGGVFTPDANGTVFNKTDASLGWEYEVVVIPNTSITTPTNELYIQISVRFNTDNSQNIDVLGIDSDGGYIPWGSAATPEDGLNDDDDTTGAESPAIPEGSSKSFRVKLAGIEGTHIANTGHDFTVRAKGSVAGMELTTQIHSRDDPAEELVLIADEDHGAMTTAMADYVQTLTPAQADLITNYDEVYLTAKIFGAAGTLNQILKPDDDLLNESNYWKDEGGATVDLFQSLDEADGDAKFIITPNDDVNKKVTVNVPAGSDPDSDSGITMQYRVRSTVAGSERLAYKVEQGNTTLLLASGGGLSTFYKNYSIPMDGSKVNWTLPFKISFYKNIPGAVATITLSWCKIVTPAAGAVAYIAEMGAAYPASSEVHTSWIEMEYSIAGDYLPGDQPRIFMGAEDILFEVLSDEIKNVGRFVGGPYVKDNNGEKSWNFTSWGNNVIATNYADPIQVLRYKSSLFEGMIDMTDTDYTDKGGVDPRCRFMGVVGSQLILADVSEASYIDGRPYTIWHSAMSEFDKFYPADYATQSTYAQILSTPGGFTGFVGGERGTIFKKNSLFRMTYVGYPPIYKYDLISKAQGTPYPRSIVPVDQDIYFLGNGGIFRLGIDNQLQQLAVGKVEKYLFDSRFEQFSLNQFISYVDTDNDALVQGAYDPHSGLILFPYSTQGTPPKACTRILCYSPKEDRFSIIAGSDLTKVPVGQLQGSRVDYIDPDWEITHPYQPQIAAIASAGNVISPESSVVKGFHMARPADINLPGNDGQGYYQRFTSGISQPMFLVSERLSASMITESPEGLNIEIQNARPIARVDGDEVPDITIQVYASETPTVIDNYQFRSADNGDRNSDGWYSFGSPVTGEFFYFVVRVGPMTLSTIKEFLGVQIEYRIAGDR